MPQVVNQAGATLSKTNGNLSTTFSGVPVSNAGTVNAGSGTLAFNGGYTQSAGATHLAGGNLSTNTTINIQGGVLDGSGNVGGNVMNAGHVNPGLSPGRITHTGTYTQLGGGALNIEINGLTPAAEHDRIDLIGTATLAGALNVSFGFVPAPGNGFTIIDNNLADAVTGTFTGLPEGAMFNADGVQLQISYAGGDGNDVVLTVGGGQPATSTPTLTRSVTQTASASPSATATATVTVTPSSTTTSVATPTGSPAASASSTPTQTATASGTATATGLATATPTHTVTASATAPGTSTPSATGLTATPTSTTSSSATASATDTASPTTSPTASPIHTEPPTPTPTATLGRINLSGVVFRPGPQGLVGVGDALVAVYVCPRRLGCLGSAGEPAATAITSRSGEFRMFIPVDTSVSNNFYFTVSLDGVPFRALIVRSPLPRVLAGISGVAPPDVVLDPISEAATRLLEQIGPENVDDDGLAAINEAVRTANAATVFNGLSVTAAADLATSTAADDPAVQQVVDERTTPTPTAPCPGDCDGRGTVTVDELIRGVNIALGLQMVEACPAFDRDHSGTVSIAELILAVNAALSGC